MSDELTLHSVRLNGTNKTDTEDNRSILDRLGFHRFRPGSATKRMTTTVATDTLDAIDALSNHLGFSRSATTNFLLAKGLAVESVQARGGVIQCLMPNGQVLMLRESVHGDWVVVDLEREQSNNNGLLPMPREKYGGK